MKMEVVWCGGDVAGKVNDELCLYIIQCGEIGRVVINDKMGHELPQNLREKKENV